LFSIALIISRQGFYFAFDELGHPRGEGPLIG
jgi:hypothetical protein